MNDFLCFVFSVWCFVFGVLCFVFCGFVGGSVDGIHLL